MKLHRLLIIFLALLSALCQASVEAQAGPYRISLSTQPKVIPVGQAKLVFAISDSSGKRMEGLDVRAIAKMPGMFMGERELKANSLPGEPGVYAMLAAFPMAGRYSVDLKISGHMGAATASIPLKTGQDTGGTSGAGFSVLSLIPWLVLLAIVIFVVVRVRASGQKLDVKSIFNRGTLGGVLLLGAMLAIAVYAVNNWRRQGAMTPLEAQVMEMNTPAPPGSTAVELATATRGLLSETVTYTGQAVGFVEQDVIPRGTGVIIWMPYYVGDKVKKGQVLARLDTSQLNPQLAEKAAMTNMAAQGVGVAASEYQTALQEIVQGRAEAAAKRGIVDEALAMHAAALQDKEVMESEVLATQNELEAARSEVVAATENSRFRTDELKRAQQLFAQGAVSRSELQQAESEAAEAQSKLKQANSMVRLAESKVSAAKASVRKSVAMIAAAKQRILQSQADVRAAEAMIKSKQSAAEAAKRNIAKEQAGVAQARAGYQSAAAQEGYAELKAEVDGVITQRLISPGVLVNPGQTVLKVAQISPIRLQANVTEADLAKITVGARVTISSRDKKGVDIQANVSSISPSVDPQARTGVVEVVWQNANARFLPGQFVSMNIEISAIQDALVAPKEAIQHPPGDEGGKPYVWIAEPNGEAGQFTIRRAEIEAGATNGKLTEILSGVKEGQQVVTAGAMYLREGGTVSAQVTEVESKGNVVEVTSVSYKPDTVDAEVGKPITITFIRRSEQGCGTEIVFPDLKINKPLPLNKPVEVTFTPTKKGILRFSCGMDMFDGKVVVR